MPIRFNTLLRESDLALSSVRLLRHMNDRGRTPYAAWMSDRDAFDDWQSSQSSRNRTAFSRPYWVSFVDTPDKGTLFVGIYSATLAEKDLTSVTDHLRGGIAESKWGTDRYSLSLIEPLSDLAGRLYVQWPAGRRWERKPENFNLIVTELRALGDEPPYPGHARFLCQLSDVETLPVTWREVLSNARGIYLLTCPRTREQYVGAAFAEAGFFGRWQQHARAGGDAAGFRIREPVDYRVSILEVAGSLASDVEIHEMEQRWKAKLQSREMGLNRN